MDEKIDKLLDDFENDIDSVGKKEEPEGLWGDTLEYIEKYIKPYAEKERGSIWDSIPDFPKNQYREEYYKAYKGPTIDPYSTRQDIITCNKCRAVYKVVTKQKRIDPRGEPDTPWDTEWDRFFCVRCGETYRVTGKIEEVEICNGEFRFGRT